MRDSAICLEAPVAPRAQNRAEATRERILGAASHLLHSKGYDAVSSADIAAAAEVSEGVIFYHFGSKRGLLESLGARYGAQIAAAMQGDATDLSTLEPGAMIARSFAHAVDAHQRNDWFAQDPDMAPFQTAARGVAVAFIEAVMRANPAPANRVGADIPVCASLAFAAVHDAIMRTREAATPADRERVMIEAVRFVRAACGYPVDVPIPTLSSPGVSA
jgi:AcrR family transcriptional regulator